MVKDIYNLKKNLFKSVEHLRGWLSVILIFNVALLVGSALFQVISNASYRDDVYYYELESLEELRGENEELKLDYEFYRSAEYQRLYFRDSLHRAEGNETLLQIIYARSQFDVVAETPDLLDEQENTRWWGSVWEMVI